MTHNISIFGKIGFVQYVLNTASDFHNLLAECKKSPAEKVYVLTEAGTFLAEMERNMRTGALIHRFSEHLNISDMPNTDKAGKDFNLRFNLFWVHDGEYIKRNALYNSLFSMSMRNIYNAPVIKEFLAWADDLKLAIEQDPKTTLDKTFKIPLEKLRQWGRYETALTIEQIRKDATTLRLVSRVKCEDENNDVYSNFDYELTNDHLIFKFKFNGNKNISGETNRLNSTLDNRRNGEQYEGSVEGKLSAVHDSANDKKNTTTNKKNTTTNKKNTDNK